MNQGQHNITIMAPEEGKSKSVGLSLEELDILDNKVAIALSRHEEIVNGWIKASNRPLKPPIMTDEEIEAQISNYGFGTGGGTSKENAAELGNKSLRAKFLPSKTLQASKARDAEEKAASAKRGLMVESSDEEEGRSSLGKAKKHKQKLEVQEPIQPVTIEREEQKPDLDLSVRGTSKKVQAGNGSQMEEDRPKKSRKRKYTSVVEESVKKTKQEQPSVTESQLDTAVAKEDSKDTIMAEGNESLGHKADVGDGRRGKEDTKKEAKRLKKQLKRDKKRKLQAEAAGLALKV